DLFESGIDPVERGIDPLKLRAEELHELLVFALRQRRGLPGEGSVTLRNPGTQLKPQGGRSTLDPGESMRDSDIGPLPGTPPDRVPARKRQRGPWNRVVDPQLPPLDVARDQALVG